MEPIFLGCVVVLVFFILATHVETTHLLKLSGISSKNIFKKATVKIIKITIRVVVHFHFETTLLFKLTKVDTTIIT